MALTFYRGNVNLPSGGDPMNAVTDALRERRLRQQQLQDRQHSEEAELERQRQAEEMIRRRMLDVHSLDNDAKLQQSLEARKAAQAAQVDSQRKAVPGIQAALGKGNADAARAAALAAGIDDFGEATAGPPAAYDDSLAPMGSDTPAPVDPKAPKKFGFTLGNQRQEFDLAPPVDNSEVAATLDDYLKHQNPVIKRAAGVLRGQVALGKEQPGRAAEQLARMEVQLRGQQRSGGGGGGAARVNAAAERGDRRLDLSEEAAARAYAKDILGGLGYKEELGKMRRFSEIASTMTHGNAALDAAAAGTFVKIAQGGSGVISDSDMNVFWNRLGGLGVRGEEGIQAALSGQMGDQKRKIVGDAVRELARTAKGNIDQIKLQFRDAYAQSPNLAKYGKQMEAAYFGGGGGAKATQPAAQASANAPSQSEDELVEMVMRQVRGGK